MTRFETVNELEWQERVFKEGHWRVKQKISVRKDAVTTIEPSFAESGFRIILINGTEFITDSDGANRLQE